MPHATPIVWSNDFSIGDDEIDSQHKRIIDLLNQLIDSKDLLSDPQGLGELLNSLMAYSREHLEYEEKLLKKINYPQFDEHQKFHQKYLAFVSELCVDHFTNGTSSLDQVNRFLKYWWEDHILIEDMQYKPFLKDAEAVQDKEIS